MDKPDVERSAPDDKRRVVPIEEAVTRLGKGSRIHTYMNAGFALLGCDHERDELIAAMHAHGVEESGPGACAMGHTLVIVHYPLDATRTTPLFIEADPCKTDG